MKKIILLLIVITNRLIIAQTSGDNYFSDIEKKEGTQVQCYIKLNNSIILGGSTFTNTRNYPCVMSIDTLGNVLWNTADLDTSIYGTNTSQPLFNSKIVDSGNGFLFFLIKSPFRSEIWKINQLNGLIIWKKRLPNPSPTFRGYDYLLNYDSTRLIVSYSFNQASNGYNNKIAFLSKLTGDTLYTKNIKSSYEGYGLTLDTQKNIYFTSFDSIYKLSNTFPHSQIWANSNPIALIKSYYLAYYDSVTNKLICMGNSGNLNRGTVVSVNSTSGVVNSFYNNMGPIDVRPQSIIAKNGFIYINWQHLYSGSNANRFAITKYNMATETTSWEVFYKINGVLSSTVVTGTAASALSVDIDGNDNLYATGYYNSSNWGIIKINGGSGNVLFEKTITLDSLRNNTSSSGIASFVINNRVYFAGHLQTYFTSSYTRAVAAIVNLNSTNGSINFIKYIKGDYKLPSKTLQIKKLNSTQTIVMKQTGRALEIEMYNFSKVLLWKKTIYRDYHLSGSNISVTPNGYIYISAFSKREPDFFSSVSQNLTDSIYIFKLNNFGQVVDEASFFIGTDNSFPLELYADNSSVLLYYQKSLDFTYLRNFNNGSFGSEVALPVNLVKLNPYIGGISTPTLSLTSRYIVNVDSTKAYLFGGTSGGNTYYSEIDKASLSVTTLTALPGSKIRYVNYVEEIDTNRVVVCGSNYNNYESIILFNRLTNDTIWSRVLSQVYNTQIVKTVIDPQKTFIYSISLNSGQITVRKIELNTGKLKWTYNYVNSVNQANFPSDINYNEFKNKLCVTGFQTINGKKEGLIVQIDTSGVPTDTIIKTGSTIGDNEVLCVETLNDGTQWAGGYINDSSVVKGFISELTNSVISMIWPGDANSDGTADNLDVLELGLHYTQTGAPRASVSNAWQSYFANNWTGTITNGKNLNHSDCNGDGTIDDNDTLAIFNNYGLTHAFKPEQEAVVNPQLSIIPDQSYVTKGNWGTASVYLGDASTNINSVNGIAFTVDFDNTLIETNSVYIEYQNSFIDAGQNLHFRKLDFANGKIFTTTTHTLNNNVSGNGLIAKLHYQIKSTLTTDETLSFGITQAAKSNASGAIVPLTSGTATLMAIGASVGLQELNGNMISISPNPTNGSLTIRSKTELQKIEVIAITGQVLLSEVPTNVSHTLRLDNFANGIYFVNLYQNSRVVKREKVVLNK